MDTVTKHPWVSAVAVGLLIALLWGTLVFRGPPITRVSLGGAMGLFWAALQGMGASYRRRQTVRGQRQGALTWTLPQPRIR